MRGIAGIAGLLVVALLSVLVYKYSFSQQKSTGAATPARTIDIVGVKTDLLSIAQAERAYQAEHGSYASLDDLNASGEMPIAKTGRDGYSYEVETSAGGFRAIAHCPEAANPGCTNWSIDQNMKVQPAP